jgi:hypothetical protein
VVPAIPGNDAFSYRLNHACDIDSQDVGISPPLISLGGHLIVDRVEAGGADSDQRFVNPCPGCRNFTDTQTGGRARFIEKNSFHDFEPLAANGRTTVKARSSASVFGLASK